MKDIFFFFHGDVGEKTAQNRCVDGRVKRAESHVFCGRFGVRDLGRCVVCDPDFFSPMFIVFQTVFFENLRKLGMDIPPFPHPSKREEVGFAEPFQAPHCFFIFPGLMIIFPDIEKCDKIRKRIVKYFLGAIRRFRFFGGPFPGVLNTQGGSNDRHLFQASLDLSFHKHSGQSGVHRKFGHQTALFRERKASLLLFCFLA